MIEPEDILSFWFVEKGPRFWWKKSDAFDAEIRDRFEQVAINIAGKMVNPPHHWEARPEHSLALIIVLDQFSRNMYRNTPAAFAWDSYALGVANRLLEKGWDKNFSENQKQFTYMPYMHSEKIIDQEKSVSLFRDRFEGDSNLFHAVEHKKLIEKFGRFPHRNSILSRQSTDEEVQFLRQGGYQP